jgi:hypothetical protein
MSEEQDAKGFWRSPLGVTIAGAAIAGLFTLAATIVSTRGGDPQGATGQAPLTSGGSATTAGITTTSATASSATPQTTEAVSGSVDTSDAEFSKKLTFPGPRPNKYVSVMLHEGLVQVNIGNADLYYGMDNRIALELVFADGWSTALPSGPIGNAECREAVETQPSGADVIRTFKKGDRICVLSGFDGGVALLEVLKAPDRTGALTVQETYWSP